MSYAAQPPQADYAVPASAPMEPPKQLRSAVALMLTLLVIGVVSFALDLITSIIVMGKLDDVYKELVITGAIFAILFMIGGLVIALLDAGAADFVGEETGVGTVVPNWYLTALVLCLAQAVISIIAMVKLFNRNTADFCNQPK